MRMILILTVGIIGGAAIVSLKNAASTERARRFTRVAQNIAIKDSARVVKTERDLTGGRSPMDARQTLVI